MTKLISCAGLLSLFLLFSCYKGVESPRGFSLPVGDPEAGRQVFLQKDCLACHSIMGEVNDAFQSDRASPIILGANSAIVKTYAELVTSIINPSHHIMGPAYSENKDENGKSTMRNYNDILTVSELIDLVAYLQIQYKVTPMHIPDYPDYEMLRKNSLEKL